MALSLSFAWVGDPLLKVRSLSSGFTWSKTFSNKLRLSFGAAGPALASVFAAGGGVLSALKLIVFGAAATCD